jgi:hypothetical protein
MLVELAAPGRKAKGEGVDGLTAVTVGTATAEISLLCDESIVAPDSVLTPPLPTCERRAFSVLCVVAMWRTLLNQIPVLHWLT